MIAIDDTSIANLGRWPWPRDLHAKMTDLLTGAKAKVVANTAFFFGTAGRCRLCLRDATGGLQAQLAAGGTESPQLTEMGRLLAEAEIRLNTDRVPADSFGRSGGIVPPMLFTLGDPKGRPDKALPDYVKGTGCRRSPRPVVKPGQPDRCSIRSRRWVPGLRRSAT